MGGSRGVTTRPSTGESGFPGCVIASSRIVGSYPPDRHSRVLSAHLVSAGTNARVIIRLAAPQTTLSHVDIDTSHFSGNECPISQVFALKLSDEEIAASAPVAVTGETKTKSKSKSKSKPLKLSPNDPRWTEVLPQVTLGPNSRHIFELDSRGKKGVWSAVLVRMIPDGGMVRRIPSRSVHSTPLYEGARLIAGPFQGVRLAAGSSPPQSASGC